MKYIERRMLINKNNVEAEKTDTLGISCTCPDYARQVYLPQDPKKKENEVKRRKVKILFS